MKKSFNVLLLFALFLAGCNFAGAERPTPSAVEAATATEAPTTVPAPTETASPLPPSATPELTPTTTQVPGGPTATSAIFPVVTVGTDTVCRTGPGKRYYAVLKITKGKSYEASGRNEDGSWLALQATRIGDDCWVPLTSLENPGDLSALNVLYTQTLPDPPLNFHASANACGVVNHLWLYWGTVNAVGYRLYRNGKEIATVYGNQYRDLNTPRTKMPTVFLYEIEAFNASGVSERQGVSVTICG